MSQPAWLKKYLRMKPEVQTIFEDLDEYREFCADFGYVFNEADLYIERSPWGEFNKIKKGKSAKDNWNSLIKQTRREENA